MAGDVVSFIVKLINQVSGPASAAAASMQGLNTQTVAATSAQRAMASASSASGAAAGAAASNYSRARDELTRYAAASTAAARALANTTPGVTVRPTVGVGAARRPTGASLTVPVAPPASVTGGKWGESVAGQAKRAREEIDRVTASYKAAGEAARSVQQATVGRAGGIGDWLGLAKANTVLGSFGRLRAGISGMTQSVKLLSVAGDSATRRVAGESFAESFGIAKTSLSELRGVASSAMGVLGGAVGIIGAVGGALLTLAKYAGLAGGALVAIGAAASVAFAKTVGEMAMLRENSIATFNALTSGKGAETFDRITASAQKLAVPINEASEGIRAMMAGGFKGDEAFKWFARMQDLSAIGVQGETLQRMVLAMSQIKGAGVLQGDELRQLQETGLNIDLIWQGISKEMGVSVAQAKKMKEQGEVTADVALKGIESAIAQMTGATEAGGARVKWLATTTGGAWASLKAAWSIGILKVAEQAKPAFDRLAPVLNQIAEWFKSDTAAEWSAALAKYFGVLVDVAIGVFDSVKRAAGPVADVLLGWFKGNSAALWGDRLVTVFNFLLDSGKTLFVALAAFGGQFAKSLGFAFDTIGGKNPLDALKDPEALKKIGVIGGQVGSIAAQFLKVTAAVVQFGMTVMVWMTQNQGVIDGVKIALMMIGVSVAVLAASVVAIGAVLAAPFILMGTAIATIIGLVQLAIAGLQQMAQAAASIPGIGILGGAVAGFATGGLAGAAAGAASGAVAGFAKGGPVKATGPALVHAGEWVVPKGGALVSELRGFADGGGVAGTGPAMLHDGEFVVPQGGSLALRGGGGSGGGGSRVFNANFNIVQASGEDGDALARRVLAVVQSWFEGEAVAEGV